MHGDHSEEEFVVRGPTLQLEFTSDGNTVYTGFDISVDFLYLSPLDLPADRVPDYCNPVTGEYACIGWLVLLVLGS